MLPFTQIGCIASFGNLSGELSAPTFEPASFLSIEDRWFTIKMPMPITENSAASTKNAVA